MIKRHYTEYLQTVEELKEKYGVKEAQDCMSFGEQYNCPLKEPVDVQEDCELFMLCELITTMRTHRTKPLLNNQKQLKKTK